MEISDLIKTNNGFIAKINLQDSYKIIRYNKSINYIAVTEYGFNNQPIIPSWKYINSMKAIKQDYLKQLWSIRK